MPSIEVNYLYSIPQDKCYFILKDKVLPSFSMKNYLRTLKIKIPNGKTTLKIMKDDYRAYLISVKLKHNNIFNGYTWGPLINIYSRSMGPGTTMVEIVSETSGYYDNRLLNSIMDMVYKKVPIYSWANRTIIPDILFDDKVILTGSMMGEKSNSFKKNLGRVMIKHTSNKIHESLKENITLIE
jgi:hypothetical protein